MADELLRRSGVRSAVEGDIDEDVGIDEDQRYFSASARYLGSSASAGSKRPAQRSTKELSPSAASSIKRWLTIDEVEGGFGFERWHKDAPPPPYHARVSPEGDQKVDRCNLVKMLLPGIFFMETLFTPAGKDAEDPDNNKVRRYRNCQYMTPETRSTSHFFWNYLRDYGHDDVAISESLQSALLEGFMEDKVLIEGQQKLLQIDEPFQPRALAADSLFMHFRHELERRIKEERKYWPPDEAKIRNPLL